MLSIGFFLLYTWICESQTVCLRYIDSLSSVNKFDTLCIKFGNNKSFPDICQLECLLALSYYSQLESSFIKFKYAKIRTTCNSRPTLYSTIFRDRQNRRYIIRINNCKKQNKVLLQHPDFNSRIGLFGHELAHVCDYNHVGGLGVVGRGLAYCTGSTKKKLENRIDKIVIQKGLGWQLHDWSYFVLNNSCATDRYKRFKQRIYLTPEQIKEEIFKNGYYHLAYCVAW